MFRPRFLRVLAVSEYWYSCLGIGIRLPQGPEFRKNKDIQYLGLDITRTFSFSCSNF